MSLNPWEFSVRILKVLIDRSWQGKKMRAAKKAVMCPRISRCFFLYGVSLWHMHNAGKSKLQHEGLWSATMLFQRHVFVSAYVKDVQLCRYCVYSWNFLVYEFEYHKICTFVLLCPYLDVYKCVFVCDSDVCRLSVCGFCLCGHAYDVHIWKWGFAHIHVGLDVHIHSHPWHKGLCFPPTTHAVSLWCHCVLLCVFDSDFGAQSCEASITAIIT